MGQDLAALLGGGGGPPPGPPPPPPDAGPGPGPPGPPGDLAALLGGGGTPTGPLDDSSAIVQQMLDLSQQYLSTEQDQEDLLTMQKISTELQQLLAKDQKDAESMMQGKPTPRGMRKALAGPGAGPLGP